MPDLVIPVVDPAAPDWEERIRRWADDAAASLGAGGWTEDSQDPEDRQGRIASLLCLAVLIESSARIGAAATASRPRSIRQGNTARIADDPQMRQLVAGSRAEAALAGAAVRAVLAGHAPVEEVLVAVAGISERLTTELFDTLGASATLEEKGLHRLWLAHQRWTACAGLAAARDRVAASVLDPS
ncbi:hypothetical protein [Sediminivirga luteola]|uniref:Uncharacterized protein n=1 Tax=Sediminivirga luteola TaxID=1774748 RepID=A0A8J2XK20_9MICO|nr:hypothetical protein [Sediminivirga luteola]GGA10376.1 hypothetical protein GCM10011333_11360 [Sediminivirga luteola]